MDTHGSYTFGKPCIRCVAGKPAEVRTPQAEHEMRTRAPKALDMGGDTPVLEYMIARTVLIGRPYNGLAVFIRWCALV
jgi:hypothetical protein